MFAHLLFAFILSQVHIDRSAGEVITAFHIASIIASILILVMNIQCKGSVHNTYLLYE